MSKATTYEAINQAEPLADAQLLTGNRNLQPALLRRHFTDAVFAAFCASRLQDSRDVFGALPARLDLRAIVARAPLH